MSWSHTFVKAEATGSLLNALFSSADAITPAANDGSLESAIQSSATKRDRVEWLIQAAAQHQPLSKEYLPKLLGNDTSLVELNLPATYMTDVSAASLADALRRNTVVTSLNLAGNYIGCDGCVALATLLKYNRTIREINLAKNDIPDEGALQLLDALKAEPSPDGGGGHCSVTLLNLDGNPKIKPATVHQMYFAAKVNTQSSAFRMVINTMQAAADVPMSTNLRIVDLTCPSETKELALDDFGALMLANALKRNKVVEVLRLCNNKISDEGATQLAFMLEDNEKLDEIDLYENMVGPKGADAFIEVLLDHNNCLTHLNLRRNLVSEERLVDVEFALALNRQPLNLKRFVLLLRENSDVALTTLRFDEHLSHRYYDDISARILADALQRNTTLTSLIMPNNHVTEVGARFLGDMLCTNTTLLHLDLANNRIAGGAVWLANSLQVNSTLRSLILKNNDINDDDGGAPAMAQMLLVNRGLTELDLCENRIQRAGAAFARAMNANTTLQQLFLEKNNVAELYMRDIQRGRMVNQEPYLLRQTLPTLYRTPANDAKPPVTILNLDYDPDKHERPLVDSSIALLAAALRDNYHVTDLSLADNDITIVGVRHLCQMLAFNDRSLTRLNISRNKDLDAEAAECIALVMCNHRSLTDLNISYNYIGEEGVRMLLDRCLLARPTILGMNVEGCRCSKPTYRAVEVMVYCHRHCVGLKPKLTRYLEIDGLNSAKHQQGRKGSGPEITITADLPEPPRFVVDFSDYHKNSDIDPEDPCYNRTVEVVATVLQDDNEMDTFAFRGNYLGDDGCQLLAEFFSTHCKITSLDVSNNRFGDAGVEALIGLVQNRHEILYVDVEENSRVSQEAKDRLRYYLQYNHLPVPFKNILLKLEKTVEGPGASMNQSPQGGPNASMSKKTMSTVTVASTRMERVLDPEDISIIDLSRVTYPLDDMCMRFFCETLRRAQSSAVADIDEIPPDGISETFAHARARSSKIGSMASIMSAVNTLVEVNLSSTYLSPKGMVMLCDVLCEGYTHGEDATPVATPLTSSVMEALPIQPIPLKRLLLDNIMIEGEPVLVANALAKLLCTNTILEELSLRTNGLLIAKRTAPTVVKILTSAAEQNMTLRLFDLDANAVPEREVEAVQALARCIDLIHLNGHLPIKRSLPGLDANTITALDFSHNDHDVRCLRPLAQSLQRNQSLIRLNLSHNLISDVVFLPTHYHPGRCGWFDPVECVREFSQAVAAHPCITEVNFQDNQLGQTIEASQALADAAARCKTLRNLNLANNKISMEGVRLFEKALKQNTGLVELRLDGNPFAPLTAHEVDCICLNNQPVVKRSVYVMSGIKPEPEKEESKESTSPAPTSLVDAVATLPTGSAWLKKKEEKVEIPYEDEVLVLDVSYAQKPGPLPTECVVPKEWDPSVNVEDAKKACTHTDVSCAVLSRLLVDNCTLHTINFSFGSITDEGAILLCDALVLNRTVRILRMDANRALTNRAAEAFASVLLVNTVLREVGLAHNRITDDGANTIIAAFELNHTVKVFDVAENPISPPVMAEMRLNVLLNNQPFPLKQAMVAAANHRRHLCDDDRLDTYDGKELPSEMKWKGGSDGVLYDNDSARILCDELISQYAGMDPAKMLAFPRAKLRAPLAITILDLSFNKITDEGSQLLALAVAKNDTLRFVSLRGNELHNGFCWAEAMRSNNSVTTLDLYETRILAYAIEKAEQLALLNLHPLKFKHEVMRLMDNPYSVDTIHINCLTWEEIHAKASEVAPPNPYRPRTPYDHDKKLHEDEAEDPSKGDLGHGIRAVTDQSCILMRRYLHNNFTLTDVDLSYNRIGDDGACALAEVLGDDRCMMLALRLAHNIISDRGACAFHAALLARHERLLIARKPLSTELKSEADLMEEGDADQDEEEKNRSTSLKDCPLQRIDLSHNYITDAAIPDLQQMCYINRAIIELNLDHNLISVEGVESMATVVAINNKHESLRSQLLPAFQNDPSVTEINCDGYVSMGFWDEKCAALVARTIRNNTHVKSVSMQFDDITNASIPAIADMLACNHTLQTLNLNNNQIESIETMLDVLAMQGPASNTQPFDENGERMGLKRLGLAHNRLTVDPIYEIAKMLRQNATLTALDLGGNEIENLGCRYLIEALKYNPSLKELGMDDLHGIQNELLDDAQDALNIYYG